MISDSNGPFFTIFVYDIKYYEHIAIDMLVRARVSLPREHGLCTLFFAVIKSFTLIIILQNTFPIQTAQFIIQNSFKISQLMSGHTPLTDTLTWYYALTWPSCQDNGTHFVSNTVKSSIRRTEISRVNDAFFQSPRTVHKLATYTACNVLRMHEIMSR